MINNPVDLYQYAEQRDIDVVWAPLPVTPSMSAQLPDKSCAIAVDPWQLPTLADEVVVLAHELGHCEEGAFYNPFTKFEVRRQKENRADKWAVRKLVSREQLDAALANGYTEIWQLAEYFGVTEEFMKKAVCYHRHGNINYEYYS